MAFKQNSFRKFLASAATATIVATAIVPAASASSTQFSDVPDFYQDAVDYLVENEITVGIGDGLYGTDHHIKRADAALMIAKALGLENYGAPDSGFEDVPDYAAKAINVLKDLEIVHGKSATSFGASDPLTRSEMAKMIALTFKIPVEGKAHPFVDVNPIYKDYVQALYNAGITVGTGETTYGANDLTTRGQFAIFLAKAKQFEMVIPDVLVSDLVGVINTDNTVTITGNASEVDKVTVVLPNGNDEIVLEALVVDGKFSVTTEIPKAGIDKISVLDAEGNILYEGIRYEAEVNVAEIGQIIWKDVTNRG